MLPAIDRVYVNAHAREELGWSPAYDFRRALDGVAAGEDPRSPLALAVGAKGYHASPPGSTRPGRAGRRADQAGFGVASEPVAIGPETCAHGMPVSAEPMPSVAHAPVPLRSSRERIIRAPPDW